MDEKNANVNKENEVKVKKKKNHNNHNKWQEQNEKLVKQNAELNDKLLRITAEMQNMKRHFEEDKTRLIKYDGEKLILEILPIVDNFERAIILDDENLSDELSKFLSGFKMIYGNLVDILNKLEVKEIECVGKPFDSISMNAVLIDHIKDVDDNIVIDCMQKGYMYKDKIIRPAMVKVNNKESEE